MIPASRLFRSAACSPTAYPATPEPLEEVGAGAPADVGAAWAFALARLLSAPDARPVALVTTADWLSERGRPFAGGMQAWGLDPGRLIWVRARREGEALWALEEALKSGAVAGGLATTAAPPFVATRRLEFAAREGRATGVILRAGPAEDLSAARRRWRIGALGSADDAFDPEAPGAPRLRAQLLKRRDGPPGGWDLERDDETGGLRVVAGLAGDGVDAGERARRSLPRQLGAA